MAMAKRKLSDEPDKLFIHKTQRSEVTETICVKIQDFTEKMDDLDNKKKPIVSPKFTLAGKELSVGVFPNDLCEDSEEFISVVLYNMSKESITASINFKSCGGGNFSIKKDLIPAGLGGGKAKFLSHDVSRSR